MEPRFACITAQKSPNKNPLPLGPAPTNVAQAAMAAPHAPAVTSFHCAPFFQDRHTFAPQTRAGLTLPPCCWHGFSAQIPASTNLALAASMHACSPSHGMRCRHSASQCCVCTFHLHADAIVRHLLVGHAGDQPKAEITTLQASLLSMATYHGNPPPHFCSMHRCTGALVQLTNSPLLLAAMCMA